MKFSIDHLPEPKRRELGRIVEILHEEFEDAIKEGSADFKKKGRILKIILFGSYARGDFVDEKTGKGYQSDYDLLIVVNNRKLTEIGTYWHKATDRFPRLVKVPVSLIIHSRRQVNDELRKGNDFFRDIRRDGIVLYELDDEPLAEPKLLSKAEQHQVAKEHFDIWFPGAQEFEALAKIAREHGWLKRSAFLYHQAIEQAYSTVLLVLTNYSPASHNLRFLRSHSEELDRRLAAVWPDDQKRYVAWFNTINEAYVKARYSEHFEISDEALSWLAGRTEQLHSLVALVCQDHLDRLKADD